MTPDGAINYGIEKLTPIIERFGFELASCESGTGSGGYAAWAVFKNQERSFEFHYRYSFGLVRYSVAAVSVTHEDLVWALGSSCSDFPGFNRSAIGQIDALASDVANITSVFFSSAPQEALQLVRKAADRPRGLGAIN